MLVARICLRPKRISLLFVFRSAFAGVSRHLSLLRTGNHPTAHTGLRVDEDVRRHPEDTQVIRLHGPERIAQPTMPSKPKDDNREEFRRHHE